MLISKEILERAGIEVVGEWDEWLPQVVIDTRLISGGECFWGLPGATSHGQDFVSSAIGKGAKIVAVEKKYGLTHTADLKGSVVFQMEDTLKGLQDLAREVRGSIGARVIAITGSNGKTTTRQLIAAGLESLGKISQSFGNFNNHIGVPLTILNAEGDEDFLVVEMGANHLGEIASLCEIAHPEVGVITNIGDAHVGEFGGYDAIEQAKGELFDYLGDSGLAVVNLDDERILCQSAKVEERVGYTLSEIPESWTKSVYLGGVVDKDAWSRLTLNIEGEKIKLALPGAHWGLSAMAAYAVACEHGADPKAVLKKIAEIVPMDGRGSVHDLGNGIELLDETYNANFASIESSLQTLANRSGFKVAVLGDVFELGDYEEDEHRRIGRIGELDDIDLVYFVGSRMAFAAEEAQLLGHDGIIHLFKEDVEGLADQLQEELEPGAGIIIKGSRLMGLEKVVNSLINNADR